MNFCQLRKEHSGLCDWRNLQKGALRSQPKRKHFLLNVSYPVIYRTPHKPFPGRNRILSANSSSVKPQRLNRSRWRIHRATIERFISVYLLEENGSLLKEGTGDAVGWALRACSYKTKTEASQQRRSRHTLQGVFLVFVIAPFSFYHFVSSSLCLFVSLPLRLMGQFFSATQVPSKSKNVGWKPRFCIFPPNPTFIFFASSLPYTHLRATLHDEGFCVEFSDQTLHT